MMDGREAALEQHPGGGVSGTEAIDIERVSDGEALCIRLSGVIDERFEASAVFRDLPKNVVLDLAGIRRITSFGVRQWSDAMKALPARVQHLYVVRAPACFVDQLNMVLNFGGRAEVITATALYFCDHCQEERQIAIDVLGEHALLVSGAAPAAPCPTCGSAMALEDDAGPDLWAVPRTEEAVPDTRQDHGIVPSRAFALAAYLDRWSGCAHHDLAASDSEPLTLAALLHLAGPEDLRRWRAADLGYADPRGAPRLRATVSAQIRKVRPLIASIRSSRLSNTL